MAIALFVFNFVYWFFNAFVPRPGITPYTQTDFLSQFAGEIQTMSNTNFHGFYGVNGHYKTFFASGCTVLKHFFLDGVLFFTILWDLVNFCRGNLGLIQMEILRFPCGN